MIVFIFQSLANVQTRSVPQYLYFVLIFSPNYSVYLTTRGRTQHFHHRNHLPIAEQAYRCLCVFDICNAYYWKFGYFIAAQDVNDPISRYANNRYIFDRPTGRHKRSQIPVDSIVDWMCYRQHCLQRIFGNASKWHRYNYVPLDASHLYVRCCAARISRHHSIDNHLHCRMFPSTNTFAWFGLRQFSYKFSCIYGHKNIPDADENTRPRIYTAHFLHWLHIGHYLCHLLRGGNERQRLEYAWNKRH